MDAQYLGGNLRALSSSRADRRLSTEAAEDAYYKGQAPAAIASSRDSSGLSPWSPSASWRSGCGYSSDGAGSTLSAIFHVRDDGSLIFFLS